MWKLFYGKKEIIKTLKRIRKENQIKIKNDANHGGYQAQNGGLLKKSWPIKTKASLTFWLGTCCWLECTMDLVLWPLDEWLRPLGKLRVRTHDEALKEALHMNIVWQNRTNYMGDLGIEPRSQRLPSHIPTIWAIARVWIFNGKQSLCKKNNVNDIKTKKLRARFESSTHAWTPMLLLHLFPVNIKQVAGVLNPH